MSDITFNSTITLPDGESITVDISKPAKDLEVAEVRTFQDAKAVRTVAPIADVLAVAHIGHTGLQAMVEARLG